MKVITAINEDYSINTNHSVKIFLAGGISNCPDWQSEAIEHFTALSNYNFTLYNPRRENFPINDPNASEQQIVWEYNHLRDSDIILYWFARGSLNPIVLYELGMWGNSRDKTIFIGIDPEYERKHDVEIQTKLARPEIIIYDNLNHMCNVILKHIYSRD